MGRMVLTAACGRGGDGVSARLGEQTVVSRRSATATHRINKPWCRVTLRSTTTTHRSAHGRRDSYPIPQLPAGAPARDDAHGSGTACVHTLPQESDDGGCDLVIAARRSAREDP